MYVIWFEGRWHEFLAADNEGVAEFVYRMQGTVMWLPIKK